MNLPKDFYTIRIESERLAREIGDCREITFDDIYSKMQADYDLNDETINYLKDLEIKTELENLVGIEENILKVQELLKQNERVILISDMYHSSNTIRMFLSHISPILRKSKFMFHQSIRLQNMKVNFSGLFNKKKILNLKNGYI